MADASLPARLKALRTSRGLSQKQLAEAAGLSQNAISQWESGAREPSWSNVLALANALGVTCQEFTGGDAGVVAEKEPDPEPPAPKKGKKK